MVAAAGKSVANRSAQGRPRKQAKTVAVDCDRLPEGAHGRRESTARVRERALRSTRIAAFPLRLSREEIVDRRVDRAIRELHLSVFQIRLVTLDLGLSLQQTLTLLAILLPADLLPSRATLGRWVQRDARRASRLLQVLDRACQSLVLCLSRLCHLAEKAPAQPRLRFPLLCKPGSFLRHAQGDIAFQA